MPVADASNDPNKSRSPLVTSLGYGAERWPRCWARRRAGEGRLFM